MSSQSLAKAALALLILFVCSSETQAAATLRVGDYDENGKLPNGTSLPLYTLTWRAMGRTFADSNYALNTTFTSDANNAFGEAPHRMLYTAVNIRDAAAFNTTRTLNGRTGEWIQAIVGPDLYYCLYKLQRAEGDSVCCIMLQLSSPLMLRSKLTSVV